MDVVRLTALLAGGFFLAFGLLAYRHFYTVLGAAAGLAAWAAFGDMVTGFPGLREHPGTASFLLLLLCLLTGVLIASKFRRILAFLGGFGTGVILSRIVTQYLGHGVLAWPPAGLARVDPMDILVGLVAGVLFLLFERFFGVLLTAVAGSVLCAWALGGRWTFLLCLFLSLIVQPLIFFRFSSGGKKGGGKGGTALLSILVLAVLPGIARGDWVVERVNLSTARIIVAAGWRDGVRQGEQYTVLDDHGSQVLVLTIGEVFSGTSYSLDLPAEKLSLVRDGMRVILLEDYQYDRAVKSGMESDLEAFLARYPGSSHKQEVLEVLDAARYRRAEQAGTLEAFNAFQRAYPTSRYGPMARKKEEELTLLRAMEKGSEEALRDFLNRFPGSTLVSGMAEVKLFLRSREVGKVYAYQDFLAAYPRSRLAEAFIPSIDTFEMWAEQLEFGSDPVEAIRHFGDLADETAVPLLVGKLTVPELEPEARKAILRIGPPALDTLMEVLISPLQSIGLKDKVALLLGRMGEISAIPALRTYVLKEQTEAGREALLMLEEKFGR